MADNRKQSKAKGINQKERVSMESRIISEMKTTNKQKNE